MFTLIHSILFFSQITQRAYLQNNISITTELSVVVKTSLFKQALSTSFRAFLIPWDQKNDENKNMTQENQESLWHTGMM